MVGAIKKGTSGKEADPSLVLVETSTCVCPFTHSLGRLCPGSRSFLGCTQETLLGLGYGRLYVSQTV